MGNQTPPNIELVDIRRILGTHGRCVAKPGTSVRHIALASDENRINVLWKQNDTAIGYSIRRTVMSRFNNLKIFVTFIMATLLATSAAAYELKNVIREPFASKNKAIADNEMEKRDRNSSRESQNRGTRRRGVSCCTGSEGGKFEADGIQLGPYDLEINLGRDMAGDWSGTVEALQ